MPNANTFAGIRKKQPPQFVSSVARLCAAALGSERLSFHFTESVHKVVLQKSIMKDKLTDLCGK